MGDDAHDHDDNDDDDDIDEGDDHDDGVGSSSRRSDAGASEK